jgi:hypothetical protein
MSKSIIIKAFLGAVVLLLAAPVANWFFPGMEDPDLTHAWWVYGVLRSFACLLWSKAFADLFAHTRYAFTWDIWLAIVWADFIDRAVFERSSFVVSDLLMYAVVIALVFIKHRKNLLKWIRMDARELQR